MPQLDIADPSAVSRKWKIVDQLWAVNLAMEDLEQECEVMLVKP